VSEVICLGSVNHALDRIEALLEKTYSSNSSGHGWYHRLESEIPGPTATEGYAKPSLKKCRPIAARNEDEKVFSGRL